MTTEKTQAQELAAYRAAFNLLEQGLNFWTDTHYTNGRTGLDYRDFKRVLHYRFGEARKIIGVAFEPSVGDTPNQGDKTDD